MKVDNDDLVSLNNEGVDFETEQLISEIELLTSRALQETQKWSGSGVEGTAQPQTQPPNNLTTSELTSENLNNNLHTGAATDRWALAN